MRGRRVEKTGGVFAGIHRGFFQDENDADGRRSFAAVEESMSDRLLGKLKLTESAKEFQKDFTWQSPKGPFWEALERRAIPPRLRASKI